MDDDDDDDDNTEAWADGGGGEPMADSTEPQSLYPPCVFESSSGLSKKFKLNSGPASKPTSGIMSLAESSIRTRLLLLPFWNAAFNAEESIL